jgi:allantoicase
MLFDSHVLPTPISFSIVVAHSRWETARHMERPSIIRTNPETGLVDTELGDWCILQLGTITAQVERLEIDTRHFKGNFPESILVEAGCARNTNETLHDENEDHDDVNFDDLTIHWFPLLNRTKLGPDKNFVFELLEEDDGGENGDNAEDVNEDNDNGGGDNEDKPTAAATTMGRSSSQPRLNPPFVDAPYISHIRVFIYPDGGISRVRVFGRPKRMERGMKRVLSGLQV